jgi:hypothetical protein
MFELLHKTRWTERHGDANMALLQLCVEAVPQSGMFMLTVSVLRMLFAETHCSDGSRTDMLFVSLVEYT